MNLENYFDWVQAIESIFEMKEYNEEKSLQLVILKLKGYASLWYEHLRKNSIGKVESKIKTWSKFKKHMDKKSQPSSYK